jgi:hypothetical protein
LPAIRHERRRKTMDNRIITLAENLVNYSCQVKPGDKVISGDGHSNLEKAFEEEVQLILSKWLLSL